MRLVRWRGGKLHITADGITTVCGSAVPPDRATVGGETVSVHARHEDARQTLDRLLAGHLGRGGSTEEVSVTVAQRTVGDLAIGDTHHEHAPEPSALAGPN
jgi:hypothetical protein